MYCDACAHPNRSEARFCAACGRPLPVSQPSLSTQSTLSGSKTLNEAAPETLSGQSTQLATPGPSLNTTMSSEADTVASADQLGLYAEFVGQTIRGYRVERKLGEGGMGAVFEATQLQLKRKVAIKVLPPAMARDRSLIERFQREAQLLANLDNPHLVPVYDMFSFAGLFFIVMGFAAGGSVKQLLRRGTLSEARAASLAYQTAVGLHAAASEGIVHRDIKPDNLLLTRKGRLKIADFGLAKASEGSSALTRTGSVMGTPPYMPPEQWEDGRKTGHRSDLYALGCALYEMLVGAPPYRGPTTANMMKQHLMEEPPDVRARRSDVSESMALIIRRLLQKDPEQRFPDGHALAQALEPLMGSTADARSGALTPSLRSIGGATLAASTGAPLARPPSRKLPLWLALAAILLLCLPAVLFHGPLRRWLVGKPEPLPAQGSEPGLTGSLRFLRLSPANQQAVRSLPFELSGRVAAEGRTLPDSVLVAGTPVEVAADGSFRHALQLEDGTHNLKLQAEGEVAWLTLVVDTRAPGIAILRPEQGSLLNGSSTEIELLVADADVAGVWIDERPAALVTPGRYRLAIDLPDGAHALTIRAEDLAGNQSSQQLSFDVDTQGPALQFLAPRSGDTLDAAQLRVRIACEDADLASLQVAGQPAESLGKAWSAALDLAPGPNEIHATALDKAGNKTVETLVVFVRETAASIAFVGVANGSVHSGPDLALRLRAQMPGLVSVTVNELPARRDGDAWAIDLVLPDGQDQTLTARATDEQGQSITGQLRVHIDRSEPRLEMISPTPGARVGDGPLHVRLRVEDANLAAVTVAGLPARRNGDLWEIELPAPEEGAQELHAEAVDAGGLRSRETRRIVVDRTAPGAIVRATLQGHLARLRIEADEPLARVRIGVGDWRAVSGAEVDLEVALPAERGPLELLIEDLAGNRRPYTVEAEALRAPTIEPIVVHGISAWWDAAALQQQAAGQLRQPVAIETSHGLRFALIPAGSFMMGSDEREPERQSDEILHEVSFSYAFYMQHAEVSQRQFEAVMGNNPSSDEGERNQPVENLTWLEAVEFCNRLSEAEKLQPAYEIEADGSVRFLGLARNGYRLPSEAEWEYACRAGTAGPFWTGANIEGREANYDGKQPMPGFKETKKRGLPRNVTDHKPNPWGLYNVHGNVYEWCNDWYGAYPGGPAQDPVGADAGSQRVMRGGSYTSRAGLCRSASRSRRRPGDRQGFIGFRMVRTIP